MEERFRSFLFKRIEETMSDLREAGSSEEVDRGLDTLETYFEELKSLITYKEPKQEQVPLTLHQTHKNAL